MSLTQKLSDFRNAILRRVSATKYVSPATTPSTNNAPAQAQPVAATQETQMSFLSVVGKDIKSVFKWIGSSNGQKTIAAGEAVAESLGAPAAVVNIANYWLGKVMTIEAVATAAGQAQGSGVTKAAAVIADVTPYVLQVAKDNGLPTPTADNISKANDAIVAFLDALGAPATSSAPAAA